MGRVGNNPVAMRQRTIFIGFLCAVLCALSVPATSRAIDEQVTEVEVSKISISELSPASKQSASDEYIVLYNHGTRPVNVAGWLLQYRSASHEMSEDKGWTTRAVIGCVEAVLANCKNDQEVMIDAGKTFRISTTKEETMLLSGMATTGGQVRLVGYGLTDEATPSMVHDFVGYGTAKAFEGTGPAVAPKAGQSIVRTLVVDVPQDTNDNAKDFKLTPAEDGADSGSDPEAPSTVDTGLAQYLAPVVTELLPDPASPQTDSEDEFIELYNPFDEAIDLDGYALVVGADWTRRYIIQDVTLGPHAYTVFRASVTNISLSNSGTGVRLLSPDGAVLHEVSSYGKAVAGSSWAQKDGDVWGWTAQPTPGLANIFVEPPVKATAVTASKKTTTSKAKSTAAKTSSSKKTAPKSTAKTAAKAPGGGAAVANQASQVNYMILAVAAAAAIGYVVFEYRREIASRSQMAWCAVKGLFARK